MRQAPGVDQWSGLRFNLRRRCRRAGAGQNTAVHKSVFSSAAGYDINGEEAATLARYGAVPASRDTASPASTEMRTTSKTLRPG